MIAASFFTFGTIPANGAIDFQKEIQPILAKKCFACHGPDEAESGLSFVDRDSALAETESGEFAIVAGNIEASTLLERIASEDEYDRMPPEGDRVTDEEQTLLRKWIEEGAAWQSHWAFEPVRQVDVPRVDSESWQTHPIDAFIYDSVQQNGLVPNAPADKRELTRRAYFGLTGLPPTKDQVDAFLADTSPNAFETLVDQLLDSPHYGERWGRHWLDLVRFAETNSFERDGPKHNAWKYRDYVIRSFNDDKPYDQFIREQLAGDELDVVTKETLTGTGFYRLGIWDDEPADPLQARYDALDDIILTTGQVFLGLTMNCARCHDHKIDPIPQRDYYSMLSFFEDVTPFARRGDLNSLSQIDVSSDELKAAYAKNDQQRKSIEARMREIEQAGIAKMSAPDQRATETSRRDRKRVLDAKLKGTLSEEDWVEYQGLKVALKDNQKELRELPAREQVLGLARYRKIAKPTFVLFRGNPHSPSDEVTPAFPDLFDDRPPQLEPRHDTQERPSGRRRVLADWIASENNRLTARVMVNRIWQFHFGRGIVRSSNNFGQLGTPPTHPELLDFLANRFVESGWSVKAMHRLILSSKTYQMSSRGNPNSLQVDPDNDSFWRFDPRRLSAEEVRDAMLAVNGSLNRRVYGPSIYPALSQEVLAGQSRPGDGWGRSNEADQNRRSVYIYVKRSLLTPMLSAFDFPDPDQTCEGRFMTLQPAQALSMLNGGFAMNQAEKLCKSAGGESESDAKFTSRVIESVFARRPTAQEIENATKLITQLATEHKLTPQRARELYCLSVMNWNEFLFLD
ncbi:MAG: PSD1 and planctomycete cytochrome C domain-containing protein [Planctomycetota bacterium]